VSTHTTDDKEYSTSKTLHKSPTITESKPSQHGQ